MILKQVGNVLLKSPQVDYVRPSQIIIAEDCFQLLSIPRERVAQVLVKSIERTFGGNLRVLCSKINKKKRSSYTYDRYIGIVEIKCRSYH